MSILIMLRVAPNTGLAGYPTYKFAGYRTIFVHISGRIFGILSADIRSMKPDVRHQKWPDIWPFSYSVKP